MSDDDLKKALVYMQGREFSDPSALLADLKEICVLMFRMTIHFREHGSHSKAMADDLEYKTSNLFLIALAQISDGVDDALAGGDDDRKS